MSKYQITVRQDSGRALLRETSSRRYVAAVIGTHTDGSEWVFRLSQSAETAAKVAAAERGRWIKGGWSPAEAPTFRAVPTEVAEVQSAQEFRGVVEGEQYAPAYNSPRRTIRHG